MLLLRRPAALLTALLVLGAGGVAGALPARAAEQVAVTILSPAAGDTVSGSISVRFRVEVQAGSAISQSHYRVSIGDRIPEPTLASCQDTCEFTFTTDSATSTFPGSRWAWRGAQIDDGPQVIRVDSIGGSSSVLGTATAAVAVDNDRPTVSVKGPAVPSGVTDGRATVDATLRLEVYPVATAPGATIADVVSTTRSTEALTTLPPAAPGEPWVVHADTSQWAEGGRNIDLAAVDSRGVKSALAPFDVMVVHGFQLYGPTVPTPVLDDDLSSLELGYSYGQYVRDTWPVHVETLLDGKVTNRQAIPDYQRSSGSLIDVRLGTVVPAGSHTLGFLVTDNRGIIEQLEIPVDVRASTTLTWVSGTGQQSPVGRPMSLTAKASTELGSISYWILENAANGEMLANDFCTTTCAASMSKTLTFTPTRAGPLSLRLRLGLQPNTRHDRIITTSVSVLPAPNDFSGDGRPDVLARTKSGALMLYRGNGRGGWAASGVKIGSGWQGFSAIVSNGDLNGDFRRDVLGRGYASQMYLYAGNGKGGWSGPGEPLNLVLPGYTVVSGLGDFDGDSRADLVARDTAGRLYLFRGRDGLTKRTQIGSGWQNFTAIFSTGDFDGDGARDVLARHKDGRLMLYPGNGRGGWAAAGKTIGTGWSGFTALTGIGDFDGDRRADVLARHKDGRLMLYRGNGKGGWAARGYAVGSGWGGFTAIVGVG